MEIRVRERLIGALILVGIVVLLVPAILTGGPKREPATAPAGEIQRVEVDLDRGLPAADADVLVPEPVPTPVNTGPASVPSPAGKVPPGPAAGAAVPREAAADAPERAYDPAPAAPEPARPVAGVAERPAWAVQLGAFSSRDKAERLVADLRKRGYAAFVLEYRANGRVLQRVRVGPEEDRARAMAVAERLRKDGFQPVVAPHP